jgi:chaperone BCS1
MHTVYIDSRTKDKIITEIDQYWTVGKNLSLLNTAFSWNLGYAFLGPTGTGKSSFMKALASHFKAPVYELRIADWMDDEKLQNLFSILPSRCFLLIEDIDSFGIGRKSSSKPRGDSEESTFKQHHVSLSGLLNAIQGVASTEGRVLIISSTCKDALVRDLLRPGRAGVHIYFKGLTRDQVVRNFLVNYLRQYLQEGKYVITNKNISEVQYNSKLADESRTC